MLNQLQIDFCEGLLRGEAYADAYEAAGYQTKTRRTARNAATNLIRKNAEVRQYLATRRREQQERTDVTCERTLKEIARVAFSDIREFMSWDEAGVTHVPSTDLTADQAAAIASVKSKRTIRTDKDGGVTEYIEMEVKAHPKMDALEKLAKVQGLYQADRMNEADVQRDLLKTVLWRYVMNLHLETGISVPEALTQAEKYPDEVQKWGKEVMLLLPSVSSS